MSKRYLIFNILFITLLIVSCKKSLNEKTDSNKLKAKDQVEKKQNTLSDHETKLYNQGVNFYARGHEPSWSLDMDFESNYHFKTLNGEEIYVPNVQGEKAMDANITRFYADVEKGTLIITIRKDHCQDSMADKTFDFNVNVKFKYGIDKEFKEFNGCGNYLPDLRLHDIWVLEAINDEPLTLNKDQQRPRFEFFPHKNEVLGNAGCNNFKAKFSVTGYQEIQIDPARMTKMTCDNLEYENLLIKNVFGKRLQYSRDGLTLNLKSYNGTRLKFKKVD